MYVLVIVFIKLLEREKLSWRCDTGTGTSVAGVRFLGRAGAENFGLAPAPT